MKLNSCHINNFQDQYMTKKYLDSAPLNGMMYLKNGETLQKVSLATTEMKSLNGTPSNWNLLTVPL